jgi:hypothetical protein
VKHVIAAFAGTAATFARMLSDKHWLDDQVPGMAIGSGAGFALPALMYYRGHRGGRPMTLHLSGS